MTPARPTVLGSALGLGLLAGALPASAATITANCTGMLNLDVYKMDPDQPQQEVAGIGSAAFSMDDTRILLTGDFGEYRFDLKAGTLYLNGSDTGIYCTYSGLDD